MKNRAQPRRALTSNTEIYCLGLIVRSVSTSMAQRVWHWFYFCAFDTIYVWLASIANTWFLILQKTLNINYIMLIVVVCEVETFCSHVAHHMKIN